MGLDLYILGCRAVLSIVVITFAAVAVEGNRTLLLARLQAGRVLVVAKVFGMRKVGCVLCGRDEMLGCLWCADKGKDEEELIRKWA